MHMIQLPWLVLLQFTGSQGLATWLALPQAAKEAGKEEAGFWDHLSTCEPYWQAVLAGVGIWVLIWRTKKTIEHQTEQLDKQLAHQHRLSDKRLEAERRRELDENLRKHYADWRARGDRFLSIADDAASSAGTPRGTFSVSASDLNEPLHEFHATTQLLLIYETDQELRLLITHAFAWVRHAQSFSAGGADDEINDNNPVVNNQHQQLHRGFLEKQVRESGAGTYGAMGPTVNDYAGYFLEQVIAKRIRLWGDDHVGA